MRLVIVVLLVIGFVGCTTLSINEGALRRSCKSGVKNYDDGSTSFECKDNVNPHQEGRK